MDARKRIEELTKIIEDANYEYYVLAEPKLTNILPCINASKSSSSNEKTEGWKTKKFIETGSNLSIINVSFVACVVAKISPSFSSTLHSSKQNGIVI